MARYPEFYSTLFILLKLITIINRMVQSVKLVNSSLDIVSSPASDPVSFLYDRQGRRKYLTISERREFLRVARNLPDLIRLFLLILAYTGARISEVLSLTPASFDEAESVVVIECLKKRRRGVFRAVPLPPNLISDVLSITTPTGARPPLDQRIWGWSRTTAWKWVKEAMHAAKIEGPKATPKGLRHAFGVSSLQTVPVTILKKWLGHSRLSTTEIYASAVGDEERVLAVKFWTSF